MIQFTFQNRNAEFINKELDVRLGKMTAQGLIRSEQEYKKVIDNMISTTTLTAFGRVTDPTKYLAVPHSNILSGMLNNMFSDVSVDLRVLYNEISNGVSILDMSLGRNKSFFRRIKNNIFSMWKEISHFRENSFNIESSDYTFFEGFDSEVSSMIIDGLTIDRKTGTVILKPISIDTHNQAEDIQDITVTVHPADNKDGGVVYTSLPVNDIVNDYNKADRDMLRYGLWKLQMITSMIPQSILDPFDAGSSTTYNGVVVYLDIVFTNKKLINELSFDPYGEFSTNIVGIRYKTDLNSAWFNASTTDSDGIKHRLYDSNSDWISFSNIDPIHVKVLRLVIHQENHSTISKLLSSVNSMVDKLVRDIMEKRFSKIDYKYNFLNELPRSVGNEDRGTLYDEVMNAIEEEHDINALESRITDILIPRPDDINADITDWKIYNLGAWAIEPKTVIYPPSALGIYHSHKNDNGFNLDSGAPTEVTLYTRQNEPGSTFIEWSVITDSGVEIPIVPNNDLWRNEAISLGINQALRTSTLRTVIPENEFYMVKLDFPVHKDYIREMTLFANNEAILDLATSSHVVEPYNSTEIYFPSKSLKAGDFITIKYIPALIDTVQCWVIIPEIVDVSRIDISQLMVFANKGTADTVAGYLNSLSPQEDGRFVTAASYSSKLMLCRKDEYDVWFSNGVVNAFADIVLDGTTFDQVIKTNSFSLGDIENVTFNMSETRMSWLYDSNGNSHTPYSENNNDNATWRIITPSTPTMVNIAKHYEQWVGTNVE